MRQISSPLSTCEDQQKKKKKYADTCQTIHPKHNSFQTLLFREHEHKRTEPFQPSSKRARDQKHLCELSSQDHCLKHKKISYELAKETAGKKKKKSTKQNSQQLPVDRSPISGRAHRHQHT
jgi:hypothetical protein